MPLDGSETSEPVKPVEESFSLLNLLMVVAALGFFLIALFFRDRPTGRI